MRTPQIRPNLLHHLRLIFGTLPPDGIGLDILIEKFVGIQLRAVARQVKQPDAFPIPIYPLFDLPGTMHRMSIDNQEDFLFVLPDQPPQKVDHDRCGKSLVEDHKGQMTSIGDCRDHIAAKPLTGSGNDRCMSLATITASDLMVGTHSHFVAPVDLGTFCAGLSANHRVLLLQPALHCLRILLVGAAQRFLRCKAPVFQIATGRPDRNSNGISLFDQLAYSLTCPQGKGQLQLIRTSVGNQTDNGGGLMTGQTRLMFGAAFVRLQCGIAAVLMCCKPIVNRRTTDAKKATGLHLRHFFVDNRMNNPTSQFLLRRRGKHSAIVRLHNWFYDYKTYMFNKLCSD